MNNESMLKSTKNYNPKGRKVLRRSKMRCYEAETDFYNNLEAMKKKLGSLLLT